MTATHPIDYYSISDKDLVDHLEKGDMQSDAALSVEFFRRMIEQGKHYRNTPEDWERLKHDAQKSVQQQYRAQEQLDSLLLEGLDSLERGEGVEVTDEWWDA